MPGGDGTGPNGMGSRTGRGLGYCAGYDSPGFTKGPGRGMGRGFGRGYGRGIGFGYGRGLTWGGRGTRWAGRGGYWGRGAGGVFYPTPVYTAPVDATPEQRLAVLKQDKSYLESELKNLQSSIEDVSNRIMELEKSE